MKIDNLEIIKPKIYDAIKNTSNDGYSIIREFLSADEIQDLKQTLYELFKTSEKKYDGKIVELKSINIQKYYLLSKYINLINFSLNNYFKKKFFLNKVWFENKVFEVNTDINYKQKLPYVPHIDRTRYFKAMIYLDKTDEANGAIQLCKKTPDNFESLRQKINKNQSLSNIIEDKNLDFYSIKGNGGDLICFDTNCPHKAGEGLKNQTRNTIRIDFETINWNNTSIFSKLKFILKNCDVSFI